MRYERETYGSLSRPGADGGRRRGGGSGGPSLDSSPLQPAQFDTAEYGDRSPRAFGQQAFEAEATAALQSQLDAFEELVYAEREQAAPAPTPPEEGFPAPQRHRVVRPRPDRQTSRPLHLQTAEWAAVDLHLRARGRGIQLESERTVEPCASGVPSVSSSQRQTDVVPDNSGSRLAPDCAPAGSVHSAVADELAVVGLTCGIGSAPPDASSGDEEVLVADGSLEEWFAADGEFARVTALGAPHLTQAEQSSVRRGVERRGRLALPPRSPGSAKRDEVLSLLVGTIWQDLVPLISPVVESLTHTPCPSPASPSVTSTVSPTPLSPPPQVAKQYPPPSPPPPPPRLPARKESNALQLPARLPPPVALQPREFMAPLRGYRQRVPFRDQHDMNTRITRSHSVPRAAGRTLVATPDSAATPRPTPPPQKATIWSTTTDKLIVPHRAESQGATTLPRLADGGRPSFAARVAARARLQQQQQASMAAGSRTSRLPGIASSSARGPGARLARRSDVQRVYV